MKGRDCDSRPHRPRWRTPVLVYRVSQRVWLSNQDLPLQMEPRKLVPRFVDPFVLPEGHQPDASEASAPEVHASPSHIPCLQSESPLVIARPPLQLIDGGPAYTGV